LATFSIVDAYLNCEDIARLSSAIVRTAQTAIFASCISASRMQRISDLRFKFALRPHHVWKYDIHIISDR